MNKGIKKAIVFSLLVGITQFGLATTATIEASGDWQQRNDQHWQENQRHEREMHRHDGENDRQWQENQDHERIGRDIDRD